MAEKGSKLTRASLAQVIEHSVLAPSATREDIVKGCELARSCGVRAMVVQPYWLKLTAMKLDGCDVLPVAVVAFPHGGSLAKTKAYEAAHLVDLGVKEIDMVMNVSALKCRSYAEVAHDIAGVVVSVERDKIPVKVILETALLADDEIETACSIARDAGAAFVKSSTGFGKGGATVEAIRLMRESVGDDMGVKASGGIRTLADVEKMLDAGADRIGTSSTERIFKELSERK